MKKVEGDSDSKEDCATSEGVCVPRDSLSAVCKALNTHHTAPRPFLVQALVTAASLCSTGEG